MSTLQFLREKAGVLVAGVIGLSLLLFVVSDFFGRGRGQRMKAKKYYELGQIAGEYISYQEFEEKFQNLLEIYKLSGNTNIDEKASEQMREETWQQLVREKILDSQYKKLGIGVSTEEVDELVLGDNPHPIVNQLFTDQKTGTFNKSFLVNFLKKTEQDETAKKYWLFFENEIVSDRMNKKYNNLVSNALYVTSKQTEFEKNLTSSTVDFSYILKNYAAIPDTSVRISGIDIETYYSEHKNSYKRSAIRNIEYVTFDVVPSEDDIKQAEQWINKTKEEFAATGNPVEYINLSADTRYVGFYIPFKDVPENLKDYVKKDDKKAVFGPYIENGSYKVARLLDVADRPDSVHVRHILISTSSLVNSTSTKAKADSLIKLIKSGTPFEVLAKTASDDKGSAQIGGDLGWFQEGRMVVPFNNACFTGKKGSIVTAETTFGTHIIEIIDQSKSIRKYNIGIIDRKIIPGTATNQKIYSEASQFAGTNNTYDKFIKSIASMSLNKQVASDVTPQQKTLPGLINARSVIMALFQAESGKIILDNSQQAVFEVGDKYVVAYCTKVQEEGIALLKDVENDIKFTLLKDKKAEIISSEFKKSFTEGKTLDDVARTMGLTVKEAAQVNFSSYSIPEAGTEPSLIGAASVAKQGVVSVPVKCLNGVYMISANSITSSQGEDLKLLQKKLMATFQMRGSYEAYEALRKGANIIDKRYKFY
jgi:peptidyl-prolyl cis-trans isomerase D